MLNNEVTQGELFKGEEIDVDQMAALLPERVDGLRDGFRPVRRALRGRPGPVGKVVKPSFEGRLDPRQLSMFDDGLDQFRCGR